MDDVLRAELRKLLAQPDRDKLLSDPRRLAELVRERLGSERKREASFLNTVMQEGVPKRLLSMSAASLTKTMIANYAKKVSEDTGQKEDIARWAIEAWMDGLGLKVASETQPRPKVHNSDTGAEHRMSVAPAHISATPPLAELKRARADILRLLSTLTVNGVPRLVIGGLLVSPSAVQLGLLFFLYANTIPIDYYGRNFSFVYNAFHANPNIIVFWLFLFVGVMSLVAAVGLIQGVSWGRKLAVAICAIGMGAYLVYDYLLFGDVFISFGVFLNQLGVFRSFMYVIYLLSNIVGLCIYASCAVYLIQGSASESPRECVETSGFRRSMTFASLTWPRDPVGRAVRVGAVVAVVSVGLAMLIGGIGVRLPVTLIGDGHTGKVSAVAFSPDGQRIAAASEDKTIKIWYSNTARLVCTLEGYTVAINSIAFSPDGHRIVSGSSEGLKIWDAETGKLQRSLLTENYFRNASTVAFSPNGQQIASDSGVFGVSIWDASTGKRLRIMGGETWIITVSFSPDGARLVVGTRGFDAANGSMISIWDVGTGQMLRQIEAKSSVDSVAFSLDGARIYSVGKEFDNNQDAVFKTWDVETGHLLLDRKVGGSASLSRDGSRFVNKSGDDLEIWETRWGGGLLRTLRGPPHVSFPSVLAFSPDGRRVVSGHYDGAVMIWNAE